MKIHKPALNLRQTDRKKHTRKLCYNRSTLHRGANS